MRQNQSFRNPACMQILLPLGADVRGKVVASLEREFKDLGISGIYS